MISITDICVGYGGRPVLAQLSMTLECGAIHGVLGLNGAGKSTLFKAICKILPIKSGTLSLNNLAISRQSVGFLPTENYFYTNITGREYLSVFPEAFELDAWNELFELPLDTLITSYSTGMKKKLALLGLLKQNRPILVLDEPFNGLDLGTVRTLRAIMQELRNTGKTLLLSSHILESLTGLCDSLHYLESGKVTFSAYGTDAVSEIQQQVFAPLEKALSQKLGRLLGGNPVS